jgi:hypothetical protein
VSDSRQPKYWCKFCKVYVRDTKFERTQHEATLRHQGSIQKSIRDIHKTKEREERDSQRAKQEVARLKGAFGAGSAPAPSTPAPSIARSAAPAPKKQATVEDRKRQMQQLADMGIIIPDEYRADMGMPGAWQTVSQRPVGDGGGPVADDVKPSRRSTGDKKRKHGDGEEEEEDGSAYVQRKGWGSRMKSYPKSGQVDDLDALLGAPIQLKNEGAAGKQEEKNTSPSAEDGEAKTNVKREDEDQPSRSNVVDDRAVDKPRDLKVEPEADGVTPSGIIFKKRKPKPTKDKITLV